MTREQMVEKTAQALAGYWDDLRGYASEPDESDLAQARHVLDALMPVAASVEALEALPDKTVGIDRWGKSRTAWTGTNGQRFWADMDGNDLPSRAVNPLTIVWHP